MRLTWIILVLLISGCEKATFEEAKTFQNKKETYPEAIRIYKELFKNDDMRAAVELGNIYSVSGPQQDLDTAFHYFRIAADNGDVWSIFQVGRHYEKGDVVPENLAFAEQRYVTAAEQGLLIAMMSLISLYDDPRLPGTSAYSKQQRHRWAVAAYEHGFYSSAASVAERLPWDSFERDAWWAAYVELSKMPGVEKEQAEIESKYGPEFLIRKQQILDMFNSKEPLEPMPWRRQYQPVDN